MISVDDLKKSLMKKDIENLIKKWLSGSNSKKGIRYFLQKEYKIIFALALCNKWRLIVLVFING